jgi:hypothetical protein
MWTTVDWFKAIEIGDVDFVREHRPKALELKETKRLEEVVAEKRNVEILKIVFPLLRPRTLGRKEYICWTAGIKAVKNLLSAYQRAHILKSAIHNKCWATLDLVIKGQEYAAQDHVTKCGNVDGLKHLINKDMVFLQPILPKEFNVPWFMLLMENQQWCASDLSGLLRVMLVTASSIAKMAELSQALVSVAKLQNSFADVDDDLMDLMQPHEFESFDKYQTTVSLFGDKELDWLDVPESWLSDVDFLATALKHMGNRVATRVFSAVVSAKLHKMGKINRAQLIGSYDDVSNALFEERLVMPDILRYFFTVYCEDLTDIRCHAVRMFIASIGCTEMTRWFLQTHLSKLTFEDTVSLVEDIAMHSPEMVPEALLHCAAPFVSKVERKDDEIIKDEFINGILVDETRNPLSAKRATDITLQFFLENIDPTIFARSPWYRSHLKPGDVHYNEIMSEVNARKQMAQAMVDAVSSFHRTTEQKTTVPRLSTLGKAAFQIGFDPQVLHDAIRRL